MNVKTVSYVCWILYYLGTCMSKENIVNNFHHQMYGGTSVYSIPIVFILINLRSPIINRPCYWSHLGISPPVYLN